MVNHPNRTKRERLNAAAPDLFEALDYLADVVEVALDSGLFLSIEGKRPDVQALRQAREALAKARG